ncbi:hypothetical protein AB205_0197030 [Aquarana catesbeiana]|uniref:Uncharacterized protein n=1 Tax=Aquarana catesbeiana TaxID=8400 RepID=A0A2G9SEX0_AQUCT|nr:hypothetical protein AB205_0197030 [Aquarana catesbeiana]
MVSLPSGLWEEARDCSNKGRTLQERTEHKAGILRRACGTQSETHLGSSTAISLFKIVRSVAEIVSSTISSLFTIFRSVAETVSEHRIGCW